jgi:hypothetical protein
MFQVTSRPLAEASLKAPTPRVLEQLQAIIQSESVHSHVYYQYNQAAHVPDNFPERVARIVAMGFSAEDASKALRLSHFNVDEAVSQLVNPDEPDPDIRDYLTARFRGPHYSFGDPDERGRPPPGFPYDFPGHRRARRGPSPPSPGPDSPSPPRGAAAVDGDFAGPHAPHPYPGDEDYDDGPGSGDVPWSHEFGPPRSGSHGDMGAFDGPRRAYGHHFPGYQSQPPPAARPPPRPDGADAPPSGRRMSAFAGYGRPELAPGPAREPQPPWREPAREPYGPAREAMGEPDMSPADRLYRRLRMRRIEIHRETFDELFNDYGGDVDRLEALF